MLATPTTEPPTRVEGDAERMVQLLNTAADLIVPTKDPVTMDRLERVRWQVRRTSLVMSLVDHLLTALNDWDPPEEGTDEGDTD